MYIYTSSQQDVHIEVYYSINFSIIKGYSIQPCKIRFSVISYLINSIHFLNEAINVGYLLHIIFKH